VSLLHPSEDDYAFAAGHAESGHKASNRRVNHLRSLLAKCAQYLPANSDISAKVAEEMLKKDEWYT
jgi:hypothetical protein